MSALPLAVAAVDLSGWDPLLVAMTLVLGAGTASFFIVLAGILIHAIRSSTTLVDQCSRCSYILRDRPEPGRCPECGHPFTIGPTGRIESRRDGRNIRATPRAAD